MIDDNVGGFDAAAALLYAIAGEPVGPVQVTGPTPQRGTFARTVVMRMVDRDGQPVDAPYCVASVGSSEPPVSPVPTLAQCERAMLASLIPQAREHRALPDAALALAAAVTL